MFILQIDGAGLTKPIDTLVQRFSDAIAGSFRPRQIRRVAQAEADAAKIREESALEIRVLRERADRRTDEENLRHQQNMETIAGKAIGHLKDDANPEAVDEDWFASFFDKARLVSDDQLQDVWAHILAGEANQSGSFSKRTLSTVADMSREDAVLFTALCGFVVDFASGSDLLVFNHRADIYRSRGITFDALFDLDAMGLIRFNSVEGFAKNGFAETEYASYFGTPVRLDTTEDNRSGLSTGTVLMTEVGRQVRTICGAEPVPEFLEYAKERWALDGIVLSLPEE